MPRTIDPTNVPADTFIGEAVKIDGRVAMVMSCRVVGSFSGEGYFAYLFAFHDQSGTMTGVGPRS